MKNDPILDSSPFLARAIRRTVGHIAVTVLILLALSLTRNPEALADAQPRIVGGTEAPAGAYPWMAALVESGLPPDRGQVCGGSLIHANWVLTAAHCLSDDYGRPISPGDINVGLGSTDLTDTAMMIHRVRRIIVHPDYDPVEIDHDVGLVELEIPSTLSPVAVYTGTGDLSGVTGTILGWGATTSSGRRYSDILRQVQVPIVSNATCDEVFAAHRSYTDGTITDTMLCAGYLEGGRDACLGDSGGPLFIDDGGVRKLAGVISWGEGCATPDYYGVYARLSRLADFIGQHVPLTRESAVLRFPHAAVGNGWETEIGLVNGGDGTLSGTLTARASDGGVVSETVVALSPRGRIIWNLGRDFANPGRITHLEFTATGDNATALGFTRFAMTGRYRAAVPASKDICLSGTLPVPHIAVSDGWWTGLALINTTDAALSPTLVFNTGHGKPLSLPARGHLSFTVASLFDGNPPDSLASAALTNASGVAGLLLFGSSDEEGNGGRLAGIHLREGSGTSLIFPHVVSDDTWWTGIALFNPLSTACGLTLTGLDTAGTVVAVLGRTLGPGQRLVNTPPDLGLPPETAWVRVSAATGLMGFELFGTLDLRRLAGYSIVDPPRREGVLPHLDVSGWTGVALVNPGTETAAVTLVAHADDGSVTASADLSLGPGEKRVKLAADLLGRPLTGAGYLRFSADQELAAFQLTGSGDDTLLDALPALGE